MLGEVTIESWSWALARVFRRLAEHVFCLVHILEDHFYGFFIIKGLHLGAPGWLSFCLQLGS